MSGAGDPRLVHHWRRDAGLTADHLKHAGETGRAEELDGFGPPVGTLVGLAARFVFGGPGVEGGLLGEFEPFGLRRGSFVIGFERVDQVGSACLDAVTTRGPAAEQARFQAGDLVDGSLPVPADWRHPQPEIPKPGGEAGGVHLGQVHLARIQRLGVQSSPLAGQRLDLGGDRHVGVQVGVTRAGVAVVEPGRGDAANRDMPGTGMAGSGRRHPNLGLDQGIVNSCRVGGTDPGRQVGAGQRPQC